MVENGKSLFQPVLTQALDHALVHLEGLSTGSVAATADLRTLRARLGKPLGDAGVPAGQVIAELTRDVEGGIVGSAGGRFFAWVIGGALPAALAADWLTAAWDQNAGLYAAGPAAAVAEEVAGAWLKDLFGLPPEASFAFVTGCQMAHVTCLAAARHRLLAERGWDVEQRGLSGAPPVRLLAGGERHGTVERAVRLLDLGKEHLVSLPADAQGRLQPEVLEQAIATAATAPTVVLLQAGELNTGAFDPFETLIPIARRYGAWVHVDGAFGLWAAASARHRHLTKGVALADSWATDGHKWLNVPYDSGYVIVADRAAHRASMSHRESYLIHDSDARDQIDWNPEWSRRARGFTTYAALRELGRNGIGDLVERCCRYAHALVMRIGALPGAEVLWEPTLNQGLVRFLDSRAGATEPDHDRRTDEVIAAILASGEAYFGGVTWRGRRAMRVSVCNWQTSDEEVDRVVSAIGLVLKKECPA
ncbi:MAG: aminotransferase class V-fold PLP-dependent enzyme [Acidobacteriia bacterium]|nr:aminotransferase class V-fold PLP-dependent enzyme [Terriglobia bacterium]